MIHSRLRKPDAALLVLAALLLVFAARLVHTANEKSFTVDEADYVGTGLYLWESGDYHFAHVLRFHPPLAFHVASIPLLFLDLGRFDASRNLGRKLIHGSDPSPDVVRLLSRAPFIALACWGAVLVFLWAGEVAGRAAAVLAAFLYTFSPTILANGSLAHSDITVSVFYLQTLYAFWRFAQRPTSSRFALCGVSLGLALCAKLSALLLLGTLGVLLAALALRWPRQLTSQWHGMRPVALSARLGVSAALGLGLLALAICVIWLGYGGSLAMTEGEGGPYAQLRLPGYVHALLFDVAANAQGRHIFFFGQHLQSGSWFHLPVAFLVKTPLPFLALLGLALATRHREPLGLGAWLAVALGVYLAVACFLLKVPLGVRYLLPVVPLLHLFVATRLGTPARTWRRAGVAAGCAWLALVSLLTHPHYLASFNPLVGGPKGAYRYLVDSNLDWGQDLGTLARYLERRGNPPIHVAYFGVEKPARYGIRARPLEGCEPVSGLVAISASVLQRLYAPNLFGPPAPEGCYDWLLERKPVAQPGNSILVYEIPESDVRVRRPSHRGAEDQSR